MNQIYFVLIAIGLTVSGGIFAQNSEDGVVLYNVEYEAPDQLSMLSFNIPIWHGGLAKTNFSIYDLKGSLHYVGAGKMNGGISYKYGLLDKILPDTEEGREYVHQSHLMSVFQPGRAQEFSAYTTFFFRESTGTKDDRFNIKRTGRIQYYTMVNTKYQKKHGISVGYSQGFTWYNMNNMTLDLYNEAYNIKRTENLQSMSTVQQYKFLTLGYQHLKMFNTKVNFANYGSRTNGRIVVTGANMIFAIQNKFDDVYLGLYNPNAGDGNGTVFFERYALSETNKRLNVGVEFYQRYFTKRFPISFEYRIAYLPGLLKNLNMMVNFGASLQIDALRGNLKKLEKPVNKDKEAFDKIKMKIKGGKAPI